MGDTDAVVAALEYLDWTEMDEAQKHSAFCCADTHAGC